MLLKILLLSLVLGLTNAGADATSAPQATLEGLEALVERLELRLRDVETRMQDEKEKQELRLEEMEMKMKYQAKEKQELEAKNKEMQTRLEAKDKEMETRLEEWGNQIKEEKDELERGLKASISELRMEVNESVKKENGPNVSNSNALTNPSLRDLPIVIISAWHSSAITSPQTVTFDSFLANFNNGNRPGGGSGVLDLDSGVFTCFTPGYYTVSFSAYGVVGPGYPKQYLFLYKNGMEISESIWSVLTDYPDGTLVGVTGSRTVVRNLFKKFA